MSDMNNFIANSWKRLTEINKSRCCMASIESALLFRFKTSNSIPALKFANEVEREGKAMRMVCSIMSRGHVGVPSFNLFFQVKKIEFEGRPCYKARYTAACWTKKSGAKYAHKAPTWNW